MTDALSDWNPEATREKLIKSLSEPSGLALLFSSTDEGKAYRAKVRAERIEREQELAARPLHVKGWDWLCFRVDYMRTRILFSAADMLREVVHWLERKA